MPRLLPLALLLLAAPLAAADAPADPPLDGPPPSVLRVTPERVELTSPFAAAQLLVTAVWPDGSERDATRHATIDAPAVVAMSPTGLVRPKSDGAGDLTVTLGSLTRRVPVLVRNVGATPAVSFVKDVEPAMSKMGCNQGTCHGAQAGKSGFKLSLRGYDPIFDFRALTDDLAGRRFNPAAPERSLMLLKPSGGVPHAGGITCAPGEPYYELLRAWIAQGVKLDLAAPRVAKIAVLPGQTTIPRPGQRQQFAVVATYTDGSRRDVSQEAFLESSNTEVATVDKAGLLTAVRRGESTVLARYEGAYAASGVVVMGDRSGFAWKAPPEHNWIDGLVDAKLKKLKIVPSDLCDDADFLRRVSLDLTGLPPSADDVRAFLADARPGRVKRDAAIDKFLASEAFNDHWANKWADLLQVNRKFLGEPGAKALRQWIRDAVANDMPYNEFAHAILAASGSNVANPPAGYYKVLRTPDAIMENTTQLFLAIRFNCNKCHDHPFERWTQDQYYELAAYFARVTLKEDPKYKGQRIGGSAVEGAKPLAELVEDAKVGEVKHDRTGADAPPKFPFTHDDLPPATLGRREQLAKWVTSADNPYFARSYVNRLWSYLLGVGVIEPVDDIRAGNPASNPELLDRLTAEYVEGGFKLRPILRTICQSRTYQLSIAANEFNKDDDANYSRALPRRLPAEVLFDGIHAATGSPASLPGLPAGGRAAQLLDSNVELPGAFLDLFGKPVRESACECERSSTLMLGPVLALVNGPVVAEAVRNPAGRLAKLAATDAPDAKLVDEIYLSVLNRPPTDTEREAAGRALHGAATDFGRLRKLAADKRAAFAAYQATLDTKQTAWESTMKARKPTAWVVVKPTKATTKAGPNPALAAEKPLTIGGDGSVRAAGPSDVMELYTVEAPVDLRGPITAVRLEALADDTLPGKGPGRAENGNFVLQQLSVQLKGARPPALKLTAGGATFEQGGFPAASAVDGNLATGWAIAGGTGQDQAAFWKVQRPAAGPAKGTLTVTMQQRFGGGHTLGKFRLAVTGDANPRLGSPLTPEQAALFGTPPEWRTGVQSAKLRAMYLAQDADYQNLRREAAEEPPATARVLGAQDLVWALLNSPAFLFNR